MWKNGQIVTINKRKYRVKSAQLLHFACDNCAFDGQISDCDRICFSIEKKLGDYQYLEEIPAKGKVLAK